MKKVLALFLFVLFLCSCEEDKNIKIESTSYDISHSVRLHYIEKNGMDYLILSGKSYDSGNSIRNLTLDSLQVEFYKQQLNK